MNSMKVLMSMHFDLFLIPSSSILYYLRLAWPTQKMKNITPYREPRVLWKRHTGNALCLDPLLLNIIRPQNGLGQDKCETLKKETTLENSRNQLKSIEIRRNLRKSIEIHGKSGKNATRNPKKPCEITRKQKRILQHPQAWKTQEIH